MVIIKAHEGVINRLEQVLDRIWREGFERAFRELWLPSCNFQLLGHAISRLCYAPRLLQFLRNQRTLIEAT